MKYLGLFGDALESSNERMRSDVLVLNALETHLNLEGLRIGE